MKTDIALSFDHELSLGSARTMRLLEAAADLAVPITLFEIGGLEGPPCVGFPEHHQAGDDAVTFTSVQAIVDLLREKNVR